MRNHPQNPASAAARVKARESTIAALFFHAGEYALRAETESSAEQARICMQRARALEDAACALRSVLP